MVGSGDVLSSAVPGLNAEGRDAAQAQAFKRGAAAAGPWRPRATLTRPPLGNRYQMRWETVIVTIPQLIQHEATKAAAVIIKVHARKSISAGLHVCGPKQRVYDFCLALRPRPRPSKTLQKYSDSTRIRMSLYALHDALKQGEARKVAI